MEREQEDQILNLYEDDDNFAQYIGVDTFKQMRDEDPRSLHKLRNSIYISGVTGADPFDVFKDYESYSKANGYSGDEKLDGVSIKNQLQKNWRDRNIAESFYEGTESVAKEGWLNYDDGWARSYLLNPSQKRHADALPNELKDLEESLSKEEYEPRRRQIKADIQRIKSSIRLNAAGRARAAEGYLSNQAERDSLRFSEELLKFRQAETLGEAISATTPTSAIQSIVGSFVEQGPGAPLTIGAGIVSGPIGVGMGGFASAFSSEISSNLGQEIASMGIDITNPGEVEANKKELQQAYWTSAEKAIPVSIAAMLGGSINFGGKALTSRAAREVAGETMFDVMGETLGSMWQTGDVDAAEAYKEMILGIAPSATMATGKAASSITSSIYGKMFKDIATREDGSPISQEEWSVMNEAVTDDEVREMGLDPAAESNIILAKNGDKNAQNMAAQVIEDANSLTPDPVKESPTDSFAVAIERLGEKVDKGVQKFVSLSTRIGEISKPAKTRVEKMDQEATLLANEGTKKTDPFIDSVNQLVAKTKKAQKSNKAAEAELNKIKAEMLNGDFDALEARGIQNVEALRDFLAERASRLPDISEIPNYFPRNIKDLDGLHDFLAKKPEGPFAKALKEAEFDKGGRLTNKERLKVINKVLKQRKGAKPGFLKSRTVEEVTPDMVKFYEDPLESLRIYNHKISDLISKRQFLGEKILDAENINAEPDYSEDAIASFVDNELQDLTQAEERQLKELLASRIAFSRSGKFARVTAAYKTAVAIKYVSGPKTIMAQMGDFATNIFENGVRDVVSNFKQRATYKNAFGEEVIATLDEAGIDAIDQALNEALKTKAGISQFILSPLRKTDMAMKQNLLSTTSKRWQRQAEQSPKQLKGELMKMFDDEKFVDGVIGDLKNKKLTPDLNLAFYVKMAEYHPIGISQHTKFYIDHPEARGLFVLKSFAFKRFDLIYKKAFQGAIQGMTEGTAAAARKDINGVRAAGAKFGESAGNLIKILTVMYTFETVLEMAYYQLTPRQDDDERKFVDSFLENVSGIFPFFNVWDFKRGIERGRLFEAIMDSLTPPAPLGADPVGEFAESFWEDKPFDWTEITEEIPFIGPLLSEGKETKKKSKPTFY